MQLDDYFEIGYILKPHGLKGSINILLDVDDPSQYSKMESVVVKIGEQLVPFFVSSLQLNGRRGIMQLEGIESREQADELKSCPLLLPIELLPKLGKGRFYYHEIIGYTVEDKKSGKLGVVTEVLSGSAQDLIVMKHQTKDILIPVVPDIIIEANHDNKILLVNLPDGLLEI
jgi:16S rRNA processing protein RimM